MDCHHVPRGVRVLLSSPTFLRLWAIGGCVNTMRWFEVLSAALFTLDATGSGLAVAVVTCRAHHADVPARRFLRRGDRGGEPQEVLLFGQTLSRDRPRFVAVLGAFGRARPWHVGVAALAAGAVWSTEMSTRRRMVGECVEGAMVSRALALDTMTNSISRLIGPMAAGAVYQVTGPCRRLRGRGAVYVVAAILIVGLPYQQTSRRILLATCRATWPKPSPSREAI